ncbi:MAG: Uncharacterized protein XD41_1425 [Desulfonauticus sp. 38_4375]|nr:MAG: Uncharacterized protein XD41_1425 [Desulfonauticus sp. 38_4375]
MNNLVWKFEAVFLGGIVFLMGILGGSGWAMNLEQEIAQKFSGYERAKKSIQISRMVKKDVNSNGKVDKILFLDESGKVVKIKYDLDEDGFWEQTVFKIKEGILVKELYVKGKYLPYHVFIFEKNNLVLEKMDKNRDGLFDKYIYLCRDKYIKKEDLNFDGKIDKITYFTNSGDILYRKEFLGDSKDTIKTIYFKSGKVNKIEEVSNDRNIVIEKSNGYLRKIVFNKIKGKWKKKIISYDKSNNVQKIIYDINGDGQEDVYEHYKDGILVGIDRDENYNGKIDFKIVYKNKNEVLLKRDRDEDGFFEENVFLNKKENKKIIEIRNEKTPIFRRIVYKNNIPVKEEIVDDKFKKVIELKVYNKERKLVEYQKKDKDGFIDVIWLYSKEGFPCLAKKDRNKDGKIDTWYFYENGKIRKVEIDKDGDGNPDSWQEYKNGKLISSRRSLLN